MGNVTLQISEQALAEIRYNLSRINRRAKSKECFIHPSDADIAQSALSYFRWAVEQSANGKAIVSTDLSNNFEMVSLPIFPAIRPER